MGEHKILGLARRRDTRCVPRGVEMWSAARIAILLFAMSTVDSVGNVTFEWKSRTHPCADRNLEFSTVRRRDTVRHEFRLGSTSVLFTKSPESGTRWNAPKALTPDISEELFFFTMQEGWSRRISTVPGLGDATVFLRYVFNTKLKQCSFFLYLDGRPFSVYTEGALSTIGKWDKKTKEALVGTYAKGLGVDKELKENAKKLDARWNEVCHFLSATENNATDVYRLSYLPSSQTFMCSMSSRTPWRHEIFFGRFPANDTRTVYVAQTGLHTTLGTAVRGNETRTVCNITFPNGRIALQEASVATTTPAPPKTAPVSPKTTIGTGTRITSGAEPETPGISETDRFDSDSTVALVIVILVSISVVTVGAFAVQRRLRAPGSKFLEITAGS